MSHAASTRRNLLALALSGLLALSALSLFVSPVAADPAASEAQFRELWGEPATTLITLTADIALTCTELDPDNPALRNSPTPIVVDGQGFTLSHPAPCQSNALLQQDALGTVTLTDLTLTGNEDSNHGLETAGSVVVMNSTISGHGRDGVHADGDVSVTNSDLSDNFGDGLEINDVGGTATVTNSTFTGNVSRGMELAGAGSITNSTVSENGGPGIVVVGDITVTGSTISNNGLDDCGAGIVAEGDVTVGSSTISGHSGVGIFAFDGDVTVTGSTVSGNGSFGCDVEGDGEGIVSEGGDVVVSGSTVTDNHGRGVFAEGGNVTVTDSEVSDNSGDQVGIEAFGLATVTRSTVDNNGDDGGGGIRADAAVVTDSTISNNAGDGIDASLATVTGSLIAANVQRGIQAGNATVTNSTIVDHTNVPAIEVRVDVTATYLTMSGNWINIQSGAPETINLFGSVLIDADSANCDGTVVDNGHNFVDDDSCGTIAPNLTPPQLGALADNGGPTWTRLPADTSPLVDAIPLASCQAGITDDQRGFTRPSDGNDDGTIGCDIGAVEVQGAIVPTAAPTGTAAPTASELPDTSLGDGTIAVTGMAAAMLILLLISASALRTAAVRQRRG